MNKYEYEHEYVGWQVLTAQQPARCIRYASLIAKNQQENTGAGWLCIHSVHPNFHFESLKTESWNLTLPSAST